MIISTPQGWAEQQLKNAPLARRGVLVLMPAIVGKTMIFLMHS